MRPRDDVDAGVGRAGAQHDLTGLEGIGDGKDEPARAGRVGGGEDLGVGGIAGDGLDAFGMQAGDRLVGVLDDQEGQFRSLSDWPTRLPTRP